jgi:hypothetical protein
MFINKNNQRDFPRYYRRKFGGGGLGSFLSGLASKAGQALKTGAKTAIHAIKTTGKDLAKKGLSAAKTLGKEALKHGKELAKEVGSHALEHAKAIGQEALGQAVQGLTAIAQEKATQLVSDIASGKDIKESIKDAAKGIGNETKDLAKNIVTNTKERGKAALRDTGAHAVKKALAKVGIDIPVEQVPEHATVEDVDESPYADEDVQEQLDEMEGEGLGKKKKKKRVKKDVDLSVLMKNAMKRHKEKNKSVA